MKFLNREKLIGGHTNKTFKVITTENSLFFKEFVFDQFNHKINYKLLNQFSFVPKHVQIEKDKMYSEYIDGDYPKMTIDNVHKIANILKELHISKLAFPPENHLKRVEVYYHIIKDKKDIPREVGENYEIVKEVISRFKNVTPLHNDPWINNFLIDKKGLIYLIDWEYATMGDRHFDIAYFIEGSNLNPEQTKEFLSVYQDYDLKKLYEAKLVVNYLTLLWLHRFDVLPFPDEKSLKNIGLIKEILHKNFN